MVIEKTTNIALKGKHGRPIVTDVFYSGKDEKMPVLIFCHGYKGFKDWGAWNLMAETFARSGIFFLKFNFSHNGGTLEEPVDFPDLEAFGRNTYTLEQDDLEVVLDWVSDPNNEFSKYLDPDDMSLMGHSRGGGSVIIKAAEDRRVKKLISLASVSDFASRFPSGKEMEFWKEKGIAYIENSRTKQKMPHLYSFYTDFKENEERLTISRAAKKLDIPFLIIHGSEDPTVDVDNAADLKEWNPQAEMMILEGSDHVFGASHPWKEEEMPPAYHSIVKKVTGFIKK